MARHRLLLLAALFFLCTSASACLNDRDSDSLATQAKGLPDVVNVITGRFERNPPLFYEMRIQRVAGELARTPEKLPLYDDIAVALDKVKRDDEAIAWMEKKRARLKSLNAKDPAVHEQWYRYYANTGTFYVHRWLRKGADRNHMEPVKKARDYIARAIELKPNAHFGREKYQLMVMKWIIDPYNHSGLQTDRQHRTLTLVEYMDNNLPEGSAGDAVTGLSGIIVLGNAWESVDIFSALGRYLNSTADKIALTRMADCRVKELIDHGGISLNPDSEKGDELYARLIESDLSAFDNGMSEQNKNTVDKVYQQLRIDAGAWQKERIDFMMPRLRASRHSDTDPHFWDGYHERPMPSIETPWYPHAQEARDAIDNLERAVVAIFCVLLGGLIAIIRFFRRRRRAVEAESV